MPLRPENKKRYPKDWPLRSRFIRFYRAKNYCERCKAENYKPHPVTGSKVILTTAHVYDHNPENCSLLNLAALCQRCHNRHDAANRKKERRARLIKTNGQLNLFKRKGANMKKWALLIIVSLSLAGCGFKDWDRTDQALYASFITLSAVEALQSRYVYENDEYYELNPIINTWLDSKDGSTIYFIGAGIAAGVIADKLPARYRTPFLTGLNAIEVGLVGHNINVGIGLEF